MKIKLLAMLTGLAFALGSPASFADPITCGSEERTATVDPAEECETGLGNPGESDIEDAFGGDFDNEGELTGDGSNGFLSVELTSGSWGGSPIEADWQIDPTFWDNYADAVISAHVGNGGGDPDWFAWLITPGATSGTFSYEILAGNGGGLSNIKLWGRGTPVDVPEPGTLALLSLGLVGAGLARRRRKA